jgi:hypothetical protein
MYSQVYGTPGAPKFEKYHTNHLKNIRKMMM